MSAYNYLAEYHRERRNNKSPITHLWLCCYRGGRQLVLRRENRAQGHEVRYSISISAYQNLRRRFSFERIRGGKFTVWMAKISGDSHA